MEVNYHQASLSSSGLLVAIFKNKIPAGNSKTTGTENGQHPPKSASVRKGLSSPNGGPDPSRHWMSEQ